MHGRGVEDEKGKRFLELIDEQSTLQWGVVSKLAALIASGWSSAKLQEELEGMVRRHSDITKELNGLDSGKL